MLLYCFRQQHSRGFAAADSTAVNVEGISIIPTGNAAITAHGYVAFTVGNIASSQKAMMLLLQAAAL